MTEGLPVAPLDTEGRQLDGLLPLCRAGLAAAERLLDAARRAVAAKVAPDGELRPALLDLHQYAAHGLAWQATLVEALRQTLSWAQGLRRDGALAAAEASILHLGFAEYLAQLSGGIPISGAELLRPSDIDVPQAALAAFRADRAVATLVDAAALPALRASLAMEIAEDRFGRPGLDDPAMEAIRDEFARFSAARVAPLAHGIHAEDRLIPLDLVDEMARMGVFALTIPEAHGGLGLGKTAMCLVSEALSAGCLAVGSLGTRSEIAAELIRNAGTTQQRERYLPAIANGTILPTAVFTEPGAGSDLGSVRTRAVRQGDVYRIHGAKTWITHGARSDLMTLLVRTGADGAAYQGLSMLLAEKPRGTEQDPFPADGMAGTEIPVLGYRGMKEYEIGFDGFQVPVSGLLGGVEGQGFKQLMETFESARIQTAARAVGVAQNALELGVAYARDRIAFGRSILGFPRVHGKLGMMAAETMMARQLTLFAARQKDSGQRCDVEAGMAKLLAARIAWTNADCALQIHGGNGYALEYPISRVLCDARVLSLFEGAAEIQAQIIARGILGRLN
jgi:(2S)-methylsuccinyl-CoA dehydrogenase